MPTRTARTAWNGTLQEGSGQVELSSSKVGTYEVSFPKRAADDAGGTTSPEELDRGRALRVLRDAAVGQHRAGRWHTAVAGGPGRRHASARTRPAASGSPASR